MRAVGGLLIALGLTAGATSVSAGAWNLPRGQGQAIVKYEDMRADKGFGDGERVDLPAQRRDQAASLFAEYGLDDQWTLQLKAEWQKGRDAFVDFEGRGPLEIGVRWQAYRDDRNAAAVYVGYAQGGEGRNAGYAQPGAGEGDLEARVMFGHSLDGGGWTPQRTFIEAQVARRWRQGLPDEVRVDATLGAHLNDRWMLLAQAYGGAADGPTSPLWVSVEGSAVRRFGDWSVQAGWRHTVAGHETALSRGPIIGLWRRF